jgi:hypothetical protein
VDARPSGGPCIDVLPDTDMFYVERNAHGSDKGQWFTMRRPDISVLYRLEGTARLTSAKRGVLGVGRRLTPQPPVALSRIAGRRVSGSALPRGRTAGRTRGLSAGKWGFVAK